MSEKPKIAPAGSTLEVHPDPHGELSILAGALRRQVERKQRRGKRHVAAAAELIPAAPPPPAVARAVLPSSTATSSPPRAATPPPAPAASRTAESVREAWEALRQKVATCQACALHQARTNTVFADGQPPARVMFIGEAPGFHEDQEGVPFVGQAGALLTDIIQKGMGLPRAEVVIANTLKCRPPENRDPAPMEKALCAPFLQEQIELVDPELIIALGRHASGALLQSTASMGQMRGKIHRPAHLGGRRVLATYHPAYLLRSPNMKKDTWADIQLGMAELGLEAPARPAAR